MKHAFLIVIALTMHTATAAEPAPAPDEPAAETAVSTAKATTQADRLELDATVVTGNRELPKVLYIVPWKKAQLGELPAQPFNTLLDEALAPLDRDVFRREVTYYGVVSQAADSVERSSAASAERSEK